jgi:hypothetical protein
MGVSSKNVAQGVAVGLGCDAYDGTFSLLALRSHVTPNAASAPLNTLLASLR